MAKSGWCLDGLHEERCRYDACSCGCHHGDLPDPDDD